MLIRLANVKGRDVDQSGIAAHVFASMLRQVVCLHVQLRLKDDKLLLQASSIGAQEVVLLEVLLQLIVVEKVVRLSRVSSIAEEATLVLHAAVFKQLVVVVEALAAEATERVTLEARLVRSTWFVVTVAHVPLQFLIRKKLMLVGEDFLVASAEVAHSLAMRRLDVTMQIGPAQPGEITRLIGTVVPQQKDGVANNLLVGVLDADVAVGGGEVAVCVGLELLVGIVGKDDIRGWCLQIESYGISMVHPRERQGWIKGSSTYTAVGTVLGLVQRPHAQAADMARLVVARRNRMVGDGVGADEADIAVVIVVVGLQLGRSRCQGPVLLVSSSSSSLFGGCSCSSFCALLSSSLSAIAAASSSSLGTASILALVASSSASATSSTTAAPSRAAFASAGG